MFLQETKTTGNGCRNLKYLYLKLWELDITKIPMTDLGYMTIESAKKVSASDSHVGRQPEIAIWPPKREIFISPELWQIWRRDSSGKSGIFDHSELDKIVAKWLRQRWTTGSGRLVQGRPQDFLRGTGVNCKARASASFALYIAENSCCSPDCTWRLVQKLAASLWIYTSMK